MNKLFSLITNKFSYVMIVTLLIGLCFQSLAKWVNPSIKYAIMAGIYLGMLKIDFKLLKAETKKPFLQFNILLFTNIALPIIMYLIMKLICLSINIDQQWAIATLVLFSAPTSALSPALCMLMGGNVERATINMVISSLIVPFTLPLLLKLMIGSSFSFDATHMMLDLIYMITVPSLLAIISKIFLREQCEKAMPLIAPISVIVLTIIVLGCVDGLTTKIINEPSLVVIGVLTAYGTAMISFFLGYFSIINGNVADKITMAIFSAWPNIGLVIVLANTYFKENYPIILFFAIIYEFPWNTTFAPAQKFIEWRQKKSLSTE